MAKRENYNLSTRVVEHIIDPIFTKGLKNRDAIKSMLVHVFSSSQVEVLIDMILQKTKYKSLYKDCYVKVRPKNYWAGDMYEKDILRDAGLLSDEGKIYGQVIADTSWDTENFNPYYHQFKVSLFIVKEDKHGWSLYETIEEMPASELELLPGKEVIKYFKVKKDDS